MTKGEREQAGAQGADAGTGAEAIGANDAPAVSAPRHVPIKHTQENPKEPEAGAPGCKECNLCWRSLAVEHFATTNRWSDKRVPYCKACMPCVRRGVKLKISVAELRVAHVEGRMFTMLGMAPESALVQDCLLYTSDAADE